VSEGVAARPAGERLSWIALAVYAAALAVLLASHEMWRDEMQMWLHARDAGSLAELWRNTRHDGHPLLWHLLLFPLPRLFASPAAAQALHWAIATAAAALVLRRAPFPLAVRAAIVLSYFPLYEYAAVTRNYGPTMLGVWIACAGLAAARTPWLAVAGVLVAANSSPMGLVLAPALAAALVLTPRWRPRVAAPLAALVAGVALAAVQCLPPADNERIVTWYFSYGIRLVAWLVRGVVMAAFPVPRPMVEFWGTSVLFPSWPFDAAAGWRMVLLAGPVALALLAAVAWTVRGSRRALAAWLLGSAGMLALFASKYPGTIRHHGFFWVLAVAVLWLAVADGALPARRAAWVLAPTLAAGLVAVAIAGVVEVRSPFSGAKGAAAAIRAQGLDRLPLVGGVDYATSAVAGYLPGGRLYYPAQRAEGSFVIYNLARMRQDRLTTADIVAEGLARDRGEGVVIVHNAPLAPGLPGACREVYAGPRAINGDERLYVYVCGVLESR
jgi:hypothetical protein